MAPVLYSYHPDDFPSRRLNEDSDSWWAGVQRCFVAVPVAGTLAVLALSSSLAFGYQQQTEDIVPQPIVLGVEDEYQQVYTPTRPLVVVQPWVIDDEVVPQPVAFVPDEDYWFAPITIRTSLSSTFSIVDDDFIFVAPAVLVFEDDQWEPLLAQRTKVVIIIW